MPASHSGARAASLVAAALVFALVPGIAADETEASSQQEPEEETRGAGPPPNVDVIRVRGRGLTDIQTDVPSSVTMFDPKELAALGAQDISDLARVAPNVEINTLSATSPTFFIRGVGLSDFNANAAGAVAIYSDGVPLNAPALQLNQLFDVENVEVLRGPQGYGDQRNASAGVIRTITRKPTGNYEARLRADFGSYDQKDVEGVLQVPLWDQWLSSRGSFRFFERDPYIRNRCGNVVDTGTGPGAGIACNETVVGRSTLIPQGLPRKVNDQHNWGARGLLRLTPPETEMDWLLNVHGSRLDQDSTLGQALGTTGAAPGRTASGYVDPVIGPRFDANRLRFIDQFLAEGFPPNEARRLARLRALPTTLEQVTRDIDRTEPFRNDYDFVGDERLNTFGSSLQGEFLLGPIEVKSITGGERYRRSQDTDFDFSSNDSIHVLRGDELWQITQNLGFQWEPPATPIELRWGGYYLAEQLDSDGVFAQGLPRIQTILQSYQQDLHSFGVFGNFDWNFIDDFNLEGGLRYNWEQKDFEMLVRRVGAIADVAPSRQSETWSAMTGGLTLTYFYSQDISAYGKYTRGWKAGHFNAGVLSVEAQGQSVARPAPSVADPETIDAFEVGLRGQWLDRRLQFGGAVFFYRYADYQVFVIENQFGSPPQLEIINANDARLWGAEADFKIEPLVGWAPRVFDGLVISGRFGWIESEFLDFSDTRIQLIPSTVPGDLAFANVTVDFSGNRLPNTPRYKVSGTVEWTWDFGAWGEIIPRYDFSWTDDIFFDPSQGRGVTNDPIFGEPPLPKYAIGQRAYFLHDLRVTYRFPNAQVEVAFWWRNVTDQVYKTFVIDTSVAFGSLLNLLGDRETKGVSISFSF